MRLCDESKLLKAFIETNEECEGGFNLIGDILLVEKLTGQEYAKEVMGPNGQKIKIHLSSGDSKKIDGLELNLPTFVRVLAVGPGYYDPSNSDAAPIQCELDPGDIILVGAMSVNWFSVFGSLVSTSSKEIGITRESEVRMRFKGQDNYDKFFGSLNTKLNPNHGQETKAL